MLLEKGEIQIGFITTGSGLQAWNGSGDWTQGRKFQSMRVLFPMYDTPIHFLALEEAGIRSVDDLPGSGRCPVKPHLSPVMVLRAARRAEAA